MPNRSLVEEIEERQGEESKKTTVWRLGGAGCVVRFGETILYIDPYLAIPAPDIEFHRAVPVPILPDTITKADAILSTHDHEDHCNEETVMAFKRNTDALFIGPVSSTRKAMAWGYPSDRTVVMRPNDIYQISPTTTILAFYSNDLYSESALTFLLKTPAGGIFHGGDTAYFEGLREIGRAHKVDIALLSFAKQVPTPSKPYYMNAKSLASAARDLKTDVVIPIHWDLWAEARDDPMSIGEWVKKMSPRAKLCVLGVGERYELDSDSL